MERTALIDKDNLEVFQSSSSSSLIAVPEVVRRELQDVVAPPVVVVERLRVAAALDELEHNLS